jgi:hypothetical protein
MATDLYVGGWDNPSQLAVFGKIDSETGAYTQINSGLGLSLDSFSGLAWDPSINAFHTRSIEGWFNTITKTGTTGHPSKINIRGSAQLVYNSQTSQLHRLLAECVSIEKNNNKAYSISGAAFVKGKVCCTVREIPGRNSIAQREPLMLYGFLDVSNFCFQPISASDRAYQGMQLAYDGSTLFGLNAYTLYTLNPVTGAYTQVAKVTGISEGNTTLKCMSAIPVSAS